MQSGDYERGMVELLFGAMPAKGHSRFVTSPTHMSPLHFHEERSAIAARGIAELLTNPAHMDTYPLSERWSHFIKAAELSPPLFEPVVLGISIISKTLEISWPREDMTNNFRLEIAEKLARHIQHVQIVVTPPQVAAMVTIDSSDVLTDQQLNYRAELDAAIANRMPKLEKAQRQLCDVIAHISLSDDTIPSNRRFDSLSTVAELLPHGSSDKTFALGAMRDMAHDKENKPWIKRHVTRIGRENDLSNSPLADFRTEMLKEIRSPMEVLADVLKLLIKDKPDYVYAPPKERYLGHPWIGYQKIKNKSREPT